jgi:hypothetical protein
MLLLDSLYSESYPRYEILFDWLYALAIAYWLKYASSLHDISQM